MQFCSLFRPRQRRLAFVETEAFEDLGVELDDLLAGEAHLLVGVDVVAFVGQGFGDSLGYYLVECGLVGITELFVEAADDAFRVLDQLIVSQEQVAGGRMRIQVFQGMLIPVLGQVQDFVYIKIGFFPAFADRRLGGLTAGIVDL